MPVVKLTKSLTNRSSLNRSSVNHSLPENMQIFNRSSRQMDIEETELRKADHTVEVNCNIFANISSGTA